MSDAVDVGDGGDRAGMPSRPRMLLITARWSHLGSHSGLTPLRPQLETVFDVQVAPPAAADKARLAADQAGRLLRRLAGQSPSVRGWSPYYTAGGSLIEGAAIRRARREAFDVVFVESIESFHARLGQIKRDRPGCRLVGMLHQPPGWHRMNNTPSDLLVDYDAVIALSAAARDHAETELGARHAVMIRHGVDDAFFVPPAAPREIRGGIDVCVVGDWLRDFDLVSQTIVRTASETPAIRWHLVIPTKSRTTSAHYRAARYDDVRWYSGISDDALRSLYQRCHLLFLPLLDATANNALLEAMSCALPVIVSDVGGVRDYARDAVTYLSSDDPGEAVAVLRRCVAEYGGALDRAADGRKTACAHLSWNVVGPAMADVALSG